MDRLALTKISKKDELSVIIDVMLTIETSADAEEFEEHMLGVSDACDEPVPDGYSEEDLSNLGTSLMITWGVFHKQIDEENAKRLIKLFDFSDRIKEITQAVIKEDINGVTSM